MADIESMNLESKDLVATRIEQLKQLFPEIAIEGNGSVDFEKLRLIMGDEVNEDDERYAFTWPGKRDAIRQSQTPSSGTLRPVVDKSRSRAGVDGLFDSDNLYIEGENLEVLKLLQHAYHGKVKLIYIDPPYNTRGDLVYPDSFDEPVKKYLEKTHQFTQSNPESDGRFHSKWCSMMYPRLKLARELLSDDGVIFISIDDNEQENLKKMCNEIFDESNFLAQVIWERAYSPVNLKKHFSESHDYILCYAKNMSATTCNGLPRSEEANDRYSNPDNDYRGNWKSSDLSVGPIVPSKVYEIVTPSGRTVLPPSGYCWRLSKEKFQEYVDDNRIWFGEDGNNVPSIKRFLSEVKQGITPMTVWKYSEVGHSQDAAQKLKKLFDGKAFFDYPKSVELIKRCLQLYTDTDCCVLDFFSGSATTAQAVFELNAEDGGCRRNILVQLQEKTSVESEAYKSGYENICEIGKDRIRRAGTKIAIEIEESNKQLNLGEDPKPIPDIGFRVFKLDESGINKQDLNATIERGELFGGNNLLDSVVKPNRSDMDIVFEMMLKWGLELTLPVEKTEAGGYQCYVVAGGELVCCMEAGLTVETLEAIAEMEPRRVLMLDSILTDTLKLNAVQIFKRVGERTGVEVELRTV